MIIDYQGKKKSFLRNLDVLFVHSYRFSFCCEFELHHEIVGKGSLCEFYLSFGNGEELKF